MNEKFIIKGLSGKRALNGSIRVSGAKNSVLKVLASTVLFRDEVTIKNVPNIEDVHKTIELLKNLGSSVEKCGSGTYKIKTNPKGSTRLSSSISRQIRASIVLTGPLLARFGSVEFPHPGGCVIGERSIDFFIEGFKNMGAKVSLSRGVYKVSVNKKLNGAEIFLKTQSVTATETFMMTAVLAKGDTVIRNAAMEPEIKDLAVFLNRSGAKIIGAGTTTITIKGSPSLITKGKTHTIMPDRIETGSFLVLGALCGKKIEVKNCNPEDMGIVIETLKSVGVCLEVRKKSIVVYGAKKINATNIKTHEYPGFPTDLQAPMVVLLTQAKGSSFIFETIFEGRLNYTETLSSMGAKITMMDPHRIIVSGPTPLRGKRLESPDLRAGLAFLIAAIVASGTSELHNIYKIDRGYENIEKKLTDIGVDVERVQE